MWGVPQGTSGSGDPAVATSGTHVIGNDLGGTVAGQAYNGTYQASKSNQVVSPVIDLMGHTSNVRLQYKRWLNVEDGSKDKGEILVDGTQRWVNTTTGNNHTDKEWRFHDVDLTADASDGKVQVTFKLSSDAAGNLGGWTIDDFCIVAAHAAAPACGDSHVDSGEQCDDGNTTAGDGCSATCQNEAPPAGCGNGTTDPGEQCDDGNTVNGDGCSATCVNEASVCGNMLPETGEQCDDGNTTDGDGCSANCQIEGGGGPECGNGVPETGEQCDDGNADDTDACKSDCTVPGSPAGGDADGGCGCSVGGRNEASGTAVALLLMAAGALWLSRRRRSRA
jgi:MYXO-CTERM domain-containing protein